MLREETKIGPVSIKRVLGVTLSYHLSSDKIKFEHRIG